MKLLHLNIALVILSFSYSTADAQGVNHNDDLRETIKSLQKAMESLQVNLSVCQGLRVFLWSDDIEINTSHHRQLDLNLNTNLGIQRVQHLF